SLIRISITDFQQDTYPLFAFPPFNCPIRTVKVCVFFSSFEFMRKITVLSMISLDGVMQGPGGPEEDTSGGFQYGGWVAPYDDEVYDQVVQQELQPAEYLLGRKTFQIWENYWPHHESFSTQKVFGRLQLLLHNLIVHFVVIRRHPASVLKAAGGIFFRSTRSLHDSIQ